MSHLYTVLTDLINLPVVVKMKHVELHQHFIVDRIEGDCVYFITGGITTIVPIENIVYIKLN